MCPSRSLTIACTGTLAQNDDDQLHRPTSGGVDQIAEHPVPVLAAGARLESRPSSVVIAYRAGPIGTAAGEEVLKLPAIHEEACG
jgi:hypothetical protein